MGMEVTFSLNFLIFFKVFMLGCAYNGKHFLKETY